MLVAIGVFCLLLREDAWAGSVAGAIGGLGLALTAAGGDLLTQHHFLDPMVALVLCLSAGMVVFSLGGAGMVVRWSLHRDSKDGSPK